ncbi:MAG: GNAT family N-acetyltransferase [Deltaproteobacteria bacterium]|nr:GNAT family N-acetyltransferase [Deltaproteobacteria bacterium]
MASKKAWSVRTFQPGPDDAGIVKLLGQVATFDGSVAAMNSDMLAARLDHPSARSGSAWRVAVASNGAIIGAVLCFFTGTVRCEVVVGVNPAFRRQGIGRALLDTAPRDRRLLCSSRESVGGARALLESSGFTERYRSLLMRKEAVGIEDLVVDDAKIVEDIRKDSRRAILALTAALGEEADDDRAWMKARLARPRAAALYLEVSGSDGKPVDGGVCVVAPCERAKKGERTAAGEPIVGVIEDIGLMKNLRGRGLSRALVRAGMRKLQQIGYRFVEVSADKRRTPAIELYVKEGFDVVDEDVHWLRKET